MSTTMCYYIDSSIFPLDVFIVNYSLVSGMIYRWKSHSVKVGFLNRVSLKSLDSVTYREKYVAVLSPFLWDPLEFHNRFAFWACSAVAHLKPLIVLLLVEIWKPATNQDRFLEMCARNFERKKNITVWELDYNQKIGIRLFNSHNLCQLIFDFFFLVGSNKDSLTKGPNRSPLERVPFIVLFYGKRSKTFTRSYDSWNVESASASDMVHKPSSKYLMRHQSRTIFFYCKREKWRCDQYKNNKGLKVLAKRIQISLDVALSWIVSYWHLSISKWNFYFFRVYNSCNLIANGIRNAQSNDMARQKKCQWRSTSEKPVYPARAVEVDYRTANERCEGNCTS